MNEEEWKIYIDNLWVNYHGKLDRIAEGKAGGQMKNFEKLVREIVEDVKDK